MARLHNGVRFSRELLTRVLRRATLSQLRWLLDQLTVELTSRGSAETQERRAA